MPPCPVPTTLAFQTNWPFDRSITVTNIVRRPFGFSVPWLNVGSKSSSGTADGAGTSGAAFFGSVVGSCEINSLLPTSGTFDLTFGGSDFGATFGIVGISGGIVGTVGNSG